LPLHRKVPVPCLRVLEDFTLRSHGEGEQVGGSPAGIINVTAGNVGRGLERWIAAQEDRIADTEAGDEAAGAGANHSFVVDFVGNARARLEVIPLNVREMLVGAAEQVFQGWIAGFGETSVSGRRKAGPGNHQ